MSNRLNGLNIALVAGGYSGEYEVSLRSQAGIRSFLEGGAYQLYDLVVTEEKWVMLQNGAEYPIDKNDFSCLLPSGERLHFDYVYMTIHGTPGENGLMLGYLDMLGIPYSCCPTATAALTFDKHFCKRYLQSYGVRVAESICLQRGDAIRPIILAVEPGLPAFVKPNTGGSSLATTRVEEVNDILPAIERAFQESESVMMERLITGTEVTCGVYRNSEGIQVLPVTEVVPEGTFFDYDAKYNGSVQEITPARLSAKMTEEVQLLTREIYQYLNAHGIIRVDFIIEEGVPTLLEVNTTPGMTATSFIPQQVAAAGLEMREVLEGIMAFGLEQQDYMKR